MKECIHNTDWSGFVWDNVDFKYGSWDVYLPSPADFAGMDDIITNFAKEREPGDIGHTPNL